LFIYLRMLNTEFFDQLFLGNTVKSYLYFVVIIGLGLLFKKIISKILSKLLFKLFKKFSSQRHDDTFVTLLLKPIELFILYSSLYAAINCLNYPLHNTFFHYSKLVGKVKENIAVTYGECIDRVFLFLIILSIFWIILRIIDFVAIVFAYRASLTDNKADDQLVPFLKELFKTLVVFIGFFTLLGFVFEVNVLTLITGLGIGGIAIALAAKESLENLLGSFTIFLDKPFTVGDVVKVDGVEGTIEKVGFRSTLIRTTEKTMATIPNKGMIDGVLENMSMRNFRRVKFTIGLTYETTAPIIKNIVKEIKTYINSHPDTSGDGNAYFESFGDSSLNIDVFYFISLTALNDYLAIKEEINFEIMDIVARNKSDFAYPTQRLIADNSLLPDQEKVGKKDDSII
jgi:MscS family membrane protein